jgi:hypothetical protein
MEVIARLVSAGAEQAHDADRDCSTIGKSDRFGIVPALCCQSGGHGYNYWLLPVELLCPGGRMLVWLGLTCWSIRRPAVLLSRISLSAPCPARKKSQGRSGIHAFRGDQSDVFPIRHTSLARPTDDPQLHENVRGDSLHQRLGGPTDAFGRRNGAARLVLKIRPTSHDTACRVPR